MHYFKKTLRKTLELLFPTFVFTIIVTLWSLGMTAAQSNDENYELPPLEQQNLEEDVTDQTSLMYDIPNIDQSRVEAAWLEMINEVRSKEAWDYIIDTKLVETSISRANTLSSERRFKNMHRRPWQKCSGTWCYDINAMSKWFAEYGITDRVVNESIWYGGYNCKKDDCTDALITATRKTFKFFMSEASRNGPHYKMIISDKYSKVWFGVALTKASRGNAYVFVMHVSE